MMPGRTHSSRSGARREDIRRALDDRIEQCDFFHGRDLATFDPNLRRLCVPDPLSTMAIRH